MFGGIILRSTRNVAENDNPNEVEFGLKTFGFNPRTHGLRMELSCR